MKTNLRYSHFSKSYCGKTKEELVESPDSRQKAVLNPLNSPFQKISRFSDFPASQPGRDSVIPATPGNSRFSPTKAYA
jgi:hypothetical protein